MFPSPGTRTSLHLRCASGQSTRAGKEPLFRHRQANRPLIQRHSVIACKCVPYQFPGPRRYNIHYGGAMGNGDKDDRAV